MLKDKRKSVGFAGIGTMGAGMCQNLAKAGFSLFVYNRTRAKAEAITSATVVNNPQELCKHTEVLFTCVSNDDALQEVLFSPRGIWATITPKHTLIDCGTTSVKLTEEIAKQCSQKKIAFLDAPITGSKQGATDGALLFMIGGTEKAFEQCCDIFYAMGKKCVLCGPNTYGQRTKIALNLAQAMILQSYLEGIVLGLKEGVSLDVLREVFDNSGAKNQIATAKMPKILCNDFSPHFQTELMNKDIKLADEEIQRLGIPLPLSKAMRGVLQEAIESGFGMEDFCALVKLLEKNAGVKVV